MRITVRPAIAHRLGRRLDRLYRLVGRLVGVGLFLVLCGHAAYDAGARGREGAILLLPACAAMPQG